MQENEHPIIIGRVSGVYGVRGWLKITSYTRPKENIFTYSPWLMRIKDTWQEIGVDEYQHRGDRLLVKLSGIDTPEDAREFIHCDLAVKHEKLPPLNEGEYYWRDLIDLEVLNQDEVKLGIIKDIVETGANDVLVINRTGDTKTRILIPLVMDVYVKKVDLIARTMHVDWQLEE